MCLACHLVWRPSLRGSKAHSRQQRHPGQSGSALVEGVLKRLSLRPYHVSLVCAGSVSRSVSASYSTVTRARFERRGFDGGGLGRFEAREGTPSSSSLSAGWLPSSAPLAAAPEQKCEGSEQVGSPEQKCEGSRAGRVPAESRNVRDQGQVGSRQRADQGQVGSRPGHRAGYARAKRPTASVAVFGALVKLEEVLKVILLIRVSLDKFRLATAGSREPWSTQIAPPFSSHGRHVIHADSKPTLSLSLHTPPPLDPSPRWSRWPAGLAHTSGSPSSSSSSSSSLSLPRLSSSSSLSAYRV